MQIKVEFFPVHPTTSWTNSDFYSEHHKVVISVFIFSFLVSTFNLRNISQLTIQMPVFVYNKKSQTSANVDVWDF